MRQFKEISRSLLNQIGIGQRTLWEGLALRRARLETAVRLDGHPARVALVGCGGMARTMARAVSILPGWTFAAVCDKNEAAASGFRAEVAADAVAYSDFQEMLQDTGAWDVLIISTTTPAHVPLALAAVHAGVRKILLEKPMASCLKDADELIRTADSRGALIAVDHVRRWIPSGQGLKRLLASGIIGRVQGLHFTFGRGGLAMIGTHLFDYARFLLDADFARLRADFDEVLRPSERGREYVDPSGRCEVYLKNGVRLTIDLSDGLPLKPSYFVVVGEHGRIEVDERLNRVRVVASGARVWEEQFLYTGSLSLGVATALFELQAEKPCRCTLRDARASLEATIACHQSVRETGRWVDLPLSGAICEERFPFA